DGPQTGPGGHPGLGGGAALALGGQHAPVLGAADYALVPEGAELGEDLVDVALPVHQVGQPWPAGLLGQGLLTGGDADQPLVALLLLDGQGAALAVGVAAEVVADPEVQVEDAQQAALGVQGQAGVEVEALGAGGVVEVAQAAGAGQVGVVEAGGVVDGVQPRQGAGLAGGGDDQGGQEGVHSGLGVCQEAVGGLARGPVGEGPAEDGVGAALQSPAAQHPTQ